MLAGKEEQRLRILELLKILDEFAVLMTKVEKEAIAAINKQMLMKKQIHELYKQLGRSEDDAWRQTYIDLHEWDQLSQHYS